MTKNQKLLNWLEKEKKKDDLQEYHYKQKIVNQMKQIKKEDLFIKPEKPTLWQKMKRIFLGI